MKLDNSWFFRTLARRGLERVNVQDSQLDDEAKGVMQHVLDSTLKELEDPEDENVVIVEGEVINE